MTNAAENENRTAPTPAPGEITTATLTVAEAGRHLRRSRAWAYKAAVDGRLPVIRTVAGLRVRTSDLMAMLGAAK